MKTALGRAWDRTIRLHVASCARCKEKLARLEDSLFQEALGEEKHAFGLLPQAPPDRSRSSRRTTPSRPSRKKAKAR